MAGGLDTQGLTGLTAYVVTEGIYTQITNKLNKSTGSILTFQIKCTV